MSSDYPVRFDVDYPDRSLNRLSTLLRIIYVIPIAIVFFLLTGVSYLSFGGLVMVPLVLMLLFRKKYPRWWFDWNLEVSRFAARYNVYLALLNDQYPSTDDQQSVHLDVDYPDAEKDLMRGMPLIKWLLALPHWIILAILGIAAYLAVVIAWFAILFTGRYPRSLFDFVVGVHRWAFRVWGYAAMMVTDRYPPFSLEP